MMRAWMTAGVVGAALLVGAPGVDAQAETTSLLQAGTMAPDFAITGATRWGVVRDAVRLSDFRGETVVLAFFPAARTRGCTIQMQTYREEYARVFNGGRDIVLLAISYDTPEDLASWAHDEDFPFLFGSDPDGTVYSSFGGNVAENGRVGGRSVVVIDGEGRIAEMIPRFREIDPTSYDELAAIVSRVTADGEDR